MGTALNKIIPEQSYIAEISMIWVVIQLRLFTTHFTSLSKMVGKSSCIVYQLFTATGEQAEIYTNNDIINSGI